MNSIRDEFGSFKGLTKDGLVTRLDLIMDRYDELAKLVVEKALSHPNACEEDAKSFIESVGLEPPRREYKVTFYTAEPDDPWEIEQTLIFPGMSELHWDQKTGIKFEEIGEDIVDDRKVTFTRK